MSLQRQNDKEGLKLVYPANTTPGIHIVNVWINAPRPHFLRLGGKEKVAKAAGDNKGKVTHTLHKGADSPAGCEVCPCVKKKDNKKNSDDRTKVICKHLADQE